MSLIKSIIFLGKIDEDRYCYFFRIYFVYEWSDKLKKKLYLQS